MPGESTYIRQSATSPAQGTAIRLPVDAPVAHARRAEMALLAGALWLLLGVAASSAGQSALGNLLAAIAVLWVLIAAAEAHDTRSLPSRVRIRARALPSPA